MGNAMYRLQPSPHDPIHHLTVEFLTNLGYLNEALSPCGKA
jgi:hypothetical protein